MFTNALAAAIDAAHPKQIDYLSRQLWQAHAAGHIGDQEAQDLAERLHGRRGVAGALFPVGGSQTPASGQNAPAGLAGPPRGYFIQRSAEQRSPDRAASIARRRRLAASGSMPPQLASKYTTSEQAIGRILADEFLAHAVVDLSRNEFGSRAGCSHSMAKRTLLRVERDGLIVVERRPRSGRRHLTNLAREIGHLGEARSGEERQTCMRITTVE